MPDNRFFCEEKWHINGSYRLDSDESAHAIRVMRVALGDEVELINGINQLGIARVIAIDKRFVEVRLKAIETQSPKTSQQLIQALVRPSRLDLIVEKGTELGMTDLWLFAGIRSEKKELGTEPLKRLKRLTISAIKQCGRLDLPRIHILPPIKEWEKELLPQTKLLFGDVSPEAPNLIEFLTNEAVSFIIGPEAGFVPEEIKELLRLGARGVNLSPYTLRTETAALAAMAVLGAVSGNKPSKRN